MSHKLIIAIMLITSLLSSCKKEREYVVYDDKKDIDKAEYQRLKTRHENKKQLKAQKAFIGLLKANQSEIFNKKIEKKAIQVNWSKSGGTSEELTSTFYFEYLDKNNLRIYVDNEKKGLLGNGLEKISFDYSTIENKNLIDTILKSYQEDLTDIDLNKLKGKSVNFKLNSYDYNFGGQQVVVGSNDYVMDFSFPLLMLEFTKKYYESTKDLAIVETLNMASKNVSYSGQVKYLKAKKINTSLYQTCRFNLNDGLSSPEYNLRFNFFWNLDC
jgi:hypothetical protein